MKYLFFLLFIYPNLTYSQTTGVVLNQFTELKKTPDLKSRTITKIAENQIITILEKSEKKVRLKENDPCEEYPWIRVKFQNKVGWVLGKHIFKIIENDTKIPIFETNIDSQTYQLISTRNFGYGFLEYNDEGNYVDTHGCPEFYAIGLYSKTANKVIFFPNNDKIKHYQNYFSTKVWGIFKDNGFSEKIETIVKKENETFEIKVFSSLQEGFVNYKIELKTKPNTEANVIDYERFND